MQSELRNRVLKCISFRCEGPTWDFKREWYHDNISLLHDILCMANQVQRDVDGIIILGVDEKPDYHICGLQKNAGEKNTQQITDFLHNIEFAGENRPEVKVENLNIEEKNVDVIVVKNSDQTPFFLSEDYPNKPQKGMLRAGAVYTRTKDTNTSRDKSATYGVISSLWKKRFGLDISDKERVHQYLKFSENWESIDGNKSYYYSKDTKIKIITAWDTAIERTKEYYCYSQLDEKPGWFDIHVKSGGTTIVKTLGVYMDGLSVAVPEMYLWGSSPFYYYVKDSFRYRLTRFFYSKMVDDVGNPWRIKSWEDCVPVFVSMEEKNLFFNYVQENAAIIEKRIEKIDVDRKRFPEGEWGTLNYRLFRRALCASEILQEMRKVHG